MKLLALVATSLAYAKDCCEFVKISAYESVDKTHDGMYRTETQFDIFFILNKDFNLDQIEKSIPALDLVITITMKRQLSMAS